MTLCRSAFTRRARLCAPILAAVPLSCLLFATNLHAQSEPASGSAEANAPQTTVTVFLNNITEQRDMNEVQTDLRTMLPRARTYSDYSSKAITVQGSSDEVAEAQKLIAEIDKPRRAYRVTYTITDADSGKPAATKHVSLVVLSGNKSVVKQGTRVPLVTGTTGQDAAPNSTQVQYIDIGLSIEASLESTAQTIQLRSKVEQSSVAEEKSGIGTQDPVIHQTQLEQVSTLVPGKALALGSLELPDSSRHEEVEVVAELIR